MDLSRFETLADAYGADLRRWPAAERPAATTLLATEPAARALLDAADALDHLLSASAVPAPSSALREAVLAAAPRAKPQGHLFRGLGFWLSGAGLAAAGIAGVLVGTAVTSAYVHDAQTEAVLAEVLPADTVAVDVLPLSSATDGGFV